MREELDKLVIEYSEKLRDCNWKNQEKAIQKLSWYLIYEKGRYSYKQIRQLETSEGNQMTLSGITSSVQRMKQNEDKKDLELVFYAKII